METDAVRRNERIYAAVREASGRGKEEIIMTCGISYNGKRHVEVLPINEPDEVAGKVAKELFAAGFNVVLLPAAPLALWNKKNEK
jgi:hypothetical protein